MAIEQNYKDLMNADIDGEISDAGKSELMAFLAKSAEGRELYEQLSSLCDSLNSGELVSPPPHMRHVIMNSVKPAKPEQDSPGMLRTLLAMPTLRYALMFAVGVFLTLSLVKSGQMSNSALDNVTGLVGTISEPIGADLASSITVDNVEIAGKVSLRSKGSMLILDFNLTARGLIEIQADYTDRTIWFNGFGQLESSGTTISAEQGHIKLGMEGKGRYAVYLHNEGGRGTTVSLRFVSNGTVIHEATLEYDPVE